MRMRSSQTNSVGDLFSGLNLRQRALETMPVNASQFHCQPRLAFIASRAIDGVGKIFITE